MFSLQSGQTPPWVFSYLRWRPSYFFPWAGRESPQNEFSWLSWAGTPSQPVAAPRRGSGARAAPALLLAPIHPSRGREILRSSPNLHSPKFRTASALYGRASYVEYRGCVADVHKTLIIPTGRFMSPPEVGPPGRGDGAIRTSPKRSSTKFRPCLVTAHRAGPIGQAFAHCC